MKITPQSVVYVANSAKIGGANRVLMDLIEGLNREKFAPAVVIPADGPLSSWLKKHDIPRFVVPTATASKPSRVLRAFRIMQVLAQTRAAILHAIDPSCYREASWAARLSGTQRVSHIQFPPDTGLLRWCFRVKPHLAISCYSGHVSEVIAEAPELQDVLTSIPNAVRLDEFVERRTVPARSEWRFGRQRMVVIVGHLSDVKGHPTFVRAAAIIRRQYPDCSFVALGGETVQPGFQRTLEDLARDLGVFEHVHFLGWRENVAEIVRAADVFALPSLKEGLPLAMLEAMASGVPVVATPVNGIPDVITSEKDGLLVPVNDPEALAAAVIRLFDNPAAAEALAHAGRLRVEREFSMAQLVERVEKAYERLLMRRTAIPAGHEALRAKA